MCDSQVKCQSYVEISNFSMQHHVWFIGISQYILAKFVAVSK